MQPIDFLLLALLAAGVLLALRAALRHPGCGGGLRPLRAGQKEL